MNNLWGDSLGVLPPDKLPKARSRCQTLVAVLSSWLRHLNEPTALEHFRLILSGGNNHRINPDTNCLLKKFKENMDGKGPK